MGRKALSLMMAILILAGPSSVRGAVREAALGSWDALTEEQLSVHHKAVAHWGMGMYETAERELKTLAAAQPDNLAFQVNLAMMRLTWRRYEEARPVLEKVLESAPRSPRVHYLLGRCLLKMDRNEEAIRRFKKAIELDSKEPAFHFKLSEAYAALNRTADLERELRQVVALQPEHGSALYRLGRMLEHSGQKKEGEELLGRFARLGKRKARMSVHCRYDDPLEPPASGPSSVAGRNWLEVRAVRTDKTDKGAESVVTVQAGRLILRQAAGPKPVRFDLSDKKSADVIRVDWGNGTQTHQIAVDANQTIVIEEMTTHVW